MLEPRLELQSSYSFLSLLSRVSQKRLKKGSLLFLNDVLQGDAQKAPPQRSSFAAAHQPAVWEQALPGGGDDTLQLLLVSKTSRQAEATAPRASASCLPQHRQCAQPHHLLLRLLAQHNVPIAHLLWDQAAAALMRFHRMV